MPGRYMDSDSNPDIIRTFNGRRLVDAEARIGFLESGAEVERKHVAIIEARLDSHIYRTDSRLGPALANVAALEATIEAQRADIQRLNGCIEDLHSLINQLINNKADKNHTHAGKRFLE